MLLEAREGPFTHHFYHIVGGRFIRGRSRLDVDGESAHGVEHPARHLRHRWRHRYAGRRIPLLNLTGAVPGMFPGFTQDLFVL